MVSRSAAGGGRGWAFEKRSYPLTTALYKKTFFLPTWEGGHGSRRQGARGTGGEHQRRGDKKRVITPPLVQLYTKKQLQNESRERETHVKLQFSFPTWRIVHFCAPEDHRGPIPPTPRQ